MSKKLKEREFFDYFEDMREFNDSVYWVCSVYCVYRGLEFGIFQASIGKSSATELQSHLYVALDQGYIKNNDFNEIYDQADKVQRQISNFIKYLQSTHNRP